MCEREGGRKATRINKAKTGQRRRPSAEKMAAAQNDPRTAANLANERSRRAESDLGLQIQGLHSLAFLEQSRTFTGFMETFMEHTGSEVRL